MKLRPMPGLMVVCAERNETDNNATRDSNNVFMTCRFDFSNGYVNIKVQMNYNVNVITI